MRAERAHCSVPTTGVLTGAARRGALIEMFAHARLGANRSAGRRALLALQAT